jgi:hypothetical protein
MNGIPVSPWLQNVSRPQQKSEVKNIDTAWATTKLSDIELSLTGDDNWCNKHPNYSGTCDSYVAFCKTVKESPHKYDDTNEKLCWTNCYTYIDFLATIPSHFQGEAADWCKMTEEKREEWKKAPENNLPENYPCANLSDWRNYLIYIDDCINAGNTTYSADYKTLWHNWNILSNETRKSLVASYNDYLDNWSTYNATGGVNKPKCPTKKVTDIDSYIKCLLSPSSYPCQDCQSWHYFETYFENDSLTFDYWSSATTKDKQTALRDYRAFQLAHTTDNEAVCYDCVSLQSKSLINSLFPDDSCENTYEYLNWTDTTYGNATNWLTFSSLSASDQRKCFYSYYKWSQTKGIAYNEKMSLPASLKATNCPIEGECWYKYVDWCRTHTTDDYYNPEQWLKYTALSTDQKRHLYIHLYDFTVQCTECGTCNKMPDTIFPTNFPSQECSDLYEYLIWDYNEKGYQRGSQWFTYDSLTNEAKRQLFYDYYEWQKEKGSVTVTRAIGSTYKPIDTTVHCLPDAIKSKVYPITDNCQDLYEHRLRTVGKTTTAAQKASVNFENWFEKYDSLSKDEKRKLWFDLNAWQEEDSTNKNTTCYELPSELKSSKYPCDTCGDWYSFYRWMVDNYPTLKDIFYDEYYSTADMTTRRSVYEKYREWQKVTTGTKTSLCSSTCFAIPLDAMDVPKTFTMLGYSEADWKNFQLGCGDVTVFERMDATLLNMQTALQTYKANGSSSYTATSGGYPTTYFTYAPYFNQLTYLSVYPNKTAQDAANDLYEAWLNNPAGDLIGVMNADAQMKAALAAAVKAGLSDVSVTRNCDIKYPQPAKVWTDYKQDGVAYDKWEDFVSSGGCETSWCEYVAWVLKNVGQTKNGSVVSLDWIHDWYKWDANYKWSTWGDNGAKALCIKYKTAYCKDLGTYCDGITEQFRKAWGQAADGSYPDKTLSDGTTLSIYKAWCSVVNNTTYNEQWTTLQTYESTAKADLELFDSKIKTEAEKYWNDDWTLTDNKTAITSANASTNNPNTGTNRCWYCTESKSYSVANGETALAGKAVMFENRYSNMPWVWKNRYKRTTNEWYIFTMFGDNSTRCQNMHLLDAQLKTCKDTFRTITGAEANDLEYGTVQKSDYDDFTAPKWWGKWAILGNGVANDSSVYHPNTGTAIMGFQYSRINYVWILPDKESDTLKNLLLWFIYDFQDYYKDNWYGATTTDSNYTYNIGHHGNIWASIWLQATARSTGYIYNDAKNAWQHNSCLCGWSFDADLKSTTADLNSAKKSGSGATQLYATMANAYNALQYYDRYYGSQTKSDGSINGYGKILTFYNDGSYSTSIKFTKDSNALWDDITGGKHNANCATSASYFCQTTGDLQNFIKWAVGKSATANLYYFFNSWSNSYSTWTQTDTVDSSGVTTTTYSPPQSIRASLAALYNSYAKKTFTVPLVDEPSCGEVDTTQPIPNQARANAKTP